MDDLKDDIKKKIENFLIISFCVSYLINQK